MKKFLDNAAIFIATGFGSGFLPWAAGSWGSLVMLILAWWIIELNLIVYGLIIVALFVIGVTVAPITDRYFHARGGVVQDNKNIVIDEFVGMLITLLPLYFITVEKSIILYGMAFLIFRLFDTLKFGLAKYFDGRHSAWGVMMDDVFAGVHAAIFFGLALWIMYIW